jgi:anionic cell wall polymer biosynthesis LytR-Cps2A-Psr (LCP) family protein
MSSFKGYFEREILLEIKLMKKNLSPKKEDITLSIEYKKPKLFWRIVLALFLFFVISILISSFIAYRKVKKYRDQFLEGAAISLESFEKTLETVANDFAFLSENPQEAIEEKTLLILGADQLEGRNGGALLTDTILVLKLDLLNNQIKTVSLPRDLYHPDYQTRINALYYYGLEKDPNNPLAFPTQAISELTSIKIDHTLVIEIEALEELVDLVGGVEIAIEEGFTDHAFPRKGVDVSIETDPSVLYETVVFEVGQETMDGNRALQYMRSRNSDGDQGNDLARGHRQQVVLEALLEQILNPSFLINEAGKVGQLYRFYLDHFDQSLSVNESAKILISYLIIHRNDEEILAPKFISFSISVFPEDKEGLILNPPLWQSQRQWIYRIRDLEVFRETLQDFFTKNELN